MRHWFTEYTLFLSHMDSGSKGSGGLRGQMTPIFWEGSRMLLQPTFSRINRVLIEVRCILKWNIAIRIIWWLRLCPRPWLGPHITPRPLRCKRGHYLACGGFTARIRSKQEQEVESPLSNTFHTLWHHIHCRYHFRIMQYREYNTKKLLYRVLAAKKCNKSMGCAVMEKMWRHYMLRNPDM